MKSKMIFKSLVAIFAGMLLAVSSAQAAVITLRSGDGVTPGTPAAPVLDPNVTMLVGPAIGDFAALTPAQFAQAAVGPAAFVVAPHPQWITPAASVDPLAHWVSVTANGSQNLAGNPNGSFSGLYAISFFIADPALSSAVLNLTAYADNVLGSATNSGMFLNGIAIPGTTGAGTVGYTTATAMSLVNLNVLSYLTQGWNTLYFDVVNTSKGPSGLMFSATLTTVAAQITVPISGVLSLFALGLLMMVFASRGYTARMSV